MKLSVIVPTRSRYGNLINTLEALFNQSLDKSQYEVIVSDDNSTDETQSVINQFKGRGNLKYIFSNVPKPHTWNASVVRNSGALLADSSTRAYIFVDSDVVLPPNALTNYDEDLNMNPHRVIIGSYDFTTQNGDRVQYKDGNGNVTAEGDIRSKKFTESNPDQVFNTVFDGLACFGGNICIPKDIFWSVGGFDVDVGIGLEDGSMGLKLWMNKTNFSYDDRVRGKHQWHETPKDRFPSDMKQHIDALNLKHFHTTEPDYGIVEASRETYLKWGFKDWQEPPEWKKNQIQFGLQIKKEEV